MFKKPPISPEQALQKLRHYCAYQERAHAEAREKLYGYGLRKTEVETCLSLLIEEGYLNEERYAIAFAGGKFRIKHWGREKIKYELKQKRISDYCIRKALAAIDEVEYEKTILQLAQKKWNSIKGEGVNGFVKMSKTRSYLQQKGFEAAAIQKVIRALSSTSRS